MYFFARHRDLRQLIGPPLLASFQRKHKLRDQTKLLAENIACLTWVALRTIMESAAIYTDYVFPREDLAVLDQQLSGHGGLDQFLHDATVA